MTRWIRKMRWFGTAFCLLAMLTLPLAYSSGYQVSEEKSAETVETEPSSAVTQNRSRCQHRQSSVRKWANPATGKQCRNLFPDFRAGAERDQLNGFGGYLWT